MKTEAEIRAWLVELEDIVQEEEANGLMGGEDWRDALTAKRWLRRVVEE